MNDESIFAAALAIADSADRKAYLDRVCAGNDALRREVEELLAAHGDANPLDHTPPDFAVTGPYALPSTSPQLIAPERTGGRVGNYKLMQKIGEGGMGEVWVAEQTEPIRRRVALKLIKPGMDSRAVLARFEAERQALALMNHPNIAKVLDGGATADGRPYFVMELVKGTPITRFCDERRMTPIERLELFVPVCQAIQHAHQKGIIHRDIKPSNVLVELHDDRPVPKVIDFGIAKAVGQQLTENTFFTAFGAVVGTPAYMSPEQASFNALDVDTRSDVYSLGVLLYELLAGTPPFDPQEMKKAAFDEVLRMVRESEPPKPSTRAGSSENRASIAAVRKTEPARLGTLLKGDLDWIVMKCLEKDRTRRYDSAAGLAADVMRHLADEPVQAGPPSAGYRMRKFVRRNRGPVTAAALVFFTLVSGVVGTTLGLLRAERLRDVAERAQTAEKTQREAAEESAKKVIDASAHLKDARDELSVNLYSARSLLIQSAWDAHQVGRVRALLEEQRPRQGEVDLRGFEWHYWDRVAHAELAVARPINFGGLEQVRGGDFSPDGRRVALVFDGTSDDISTIVVRDFPSGTPICSFDFKLIEPRERGKLKHELRVTFTDDSESLLVATSSYSSNAEPDLSSGLTWSLLGQLPTARFHWQLFDSVTGKKISERRSVASSQTTGNTFRQHRKFLALPHPVQKPDRYRLNIWSASDGQLVTTCDCTFIEVRRTEFRPDGAEIAAVIRMPGEPSDNIYVKIFSTSTGRERLSIKLPARHMQAGDLVWGPNDRLGVALEGIHIFSATDGKQLIVTSTEQGTPKSLHFSPDGTRIASIEQGGRLATIRDANTGQVRTTMKIPEDAGRIAFSADGARLITISDDGTVRSWDATVSELPKPLENFIPDPAIWYSGPFVATSADGSRIAMVIGEASTTTRMFVWNDKAEQVAVIERDVQPKKNTAESGVRFTLARLVGDTRVALSGDGRYAAWQFVKGWAERPNKEPKRIYRVVMIDLATQQDLWFRDDTAFSSFRFSPDGKSLAIATSTYTDPTKPNEGTVRILRVETGAESHSFSANCSTLHYSQDGNLLVGLGYPKERNVHIPFPLRVWDLQAGMELPAGEYPTKLVGVPGLQASALSPDGKVLAISWLNREAGEGAVRLFDVPSGRELRSLNGHDDAIGKIAWSPDGKRLAAVGRTVKMWDVSSRKELLTLRARFDYVYVLKFSADGKRLHAVVLDNGVHSTKTWDATPRNQR